MDPKAAKYKKEKAQSIKPLYELLQKERNEIIQLPEIFLNLSLENKKFQKLLQVCKDDILFMSKTHGQKKMEVLEDENSSQTSQTGFDSGLVKKNKIEEIRSNIMNNISNFYALKYIKIIIILIGIFTIIFSGFYINNFISLIINLNRSTSFNINLYQSTLWTTELISIFVNIRVLYLKEIINKYNNSNIDFEYYDFLTNGTNLTEYYEYCISKSLYLYNLLYEYYGLLEMEAPIYLNEIELDNIYWDKINISYMNDNYKLFYNAEDEESFPLSIAQLLSNSHSYLKSNTFNNIISNISFFENENNNRNYFDYMTFLIIENGFNNILPNLFNKLMNIPNILIKFNYSQLINLNLIIAIYIILEILLCVWFFILICLTNKSMIDGMDKIAKIKLEKIEEIIKKIKLFNTNLKKFNERNLKNENNKENSDIFDEYSKIKSDNKNDLNNDKNKKKIEQESTLVNNNGFNTDYKKYIPLNVLKYSSVYSFIFIIYILMYIIPLYIYYTQKIKNTNLLLIVENYIFSKLITTSTSTIELKCFISDCKDIKKLNYSELINYNIIKEVIQGLNYFSKVNNFYNEKFLLNACGASISNDTGEEYKECLNDNTIKTANNTENLLKLIEDLIFSLNKKYEINNDTNSLYYKKNLFNETYYKEIEKIFFKYFMNVDGNFVSCLLEDLIFYLFKSQIIVIIIMVSFAIIAIIFCIIYKIVILKKLIHYLTVSRCIMKIIPTSVIMNTQELETWIENKY